MSKPGAVWEQRELFYTKTEMNLDLRMGSTTWRMTQARMEAFVPGGDAVLADVYRRVRGTRSWHPVVKELKKILDERGGEAV